MPYRIAEYTQALSEIAKLLNSCKGKGKVLNRVLNILCLAASAQGAVLVKKSFIGNRNFTLENLGFWNFKSDNVAFEGYEFKLFKPEEFPVEVWEKLESHEIVFAKGPLMTGLCGLSNIMLLPIFLERDLFGFIAIWNVTKVTLSSPKSFFGSYR